ncbi:MAG: TetR/AcrR family transcriptional regulator, partial [Acidiferrobacteraceae bacterium]
GFHRTSLADIAKAADVPLGNVYYYFKTKEEIGTGLVARRANYYQKLREDWAHQPDPRSRLHAFIQMTADNRERLAQSGCPIGSLCQELHKGDDGALAQLASQMLVAWIEWLVIQFRLLGKAEQSHALALHLLSALQGASLLTNSFRDPDLMLAETRHLGEWVDAL